MARIASFIILARAAMVLANTAPRTAGPIEAYSGLTDFACPISGCCLGGACCGSGCCDYTDVCIYPTPPQAACWRFDDPTLCGSKNSSSGTDDVGDDPDCERTRPCVNFNGPWSCYLGKTCGLGYKDCDPCPAALAALSSATASSPSSTLYSADESTSTQDSSPSSTSDSTSTATTIDNPSLETSTANSVRSTATATTASPAAISTSSNEGSRSMYGRLGWKAAAVLAPAYVLAV